MRTTQLNIDDKFLKRVLMVVGLVTAVTLLSIFAWQVLEILLLLFVGILLSVFFTSISGWIRERTPLSHKAAFLLTIFVLLVLVALTGWLAAPSLVTQTEQLSSNLQESVQSVQTTLSNQAWSQPILDRLPAPEEIDATSSAFMNGVTGIFSRTINIVTNSVIILFIGIYLALEPDLYANGLIKLAPKPYRRRMGEVLDEVAYTLRWWLIGRLASMVIVGLLSMLGLYLLGIPLAFILGILTGLLAFIPIIGPLLALVLPVLIAFTISPTQALYVFLLYMGIQFIESYFITPLIQQKTVALPPVLLILSQVTFGFFFNFVGLAVAAPVAAMLFTLTKMLYVIDVLGDEETELLKENPDPHFTASSPLINES